MIRFVSCPCEECGEITAKEAKTLKLFIAAGALVALIILAYLYATQPDIKEDRLVIQEGWPTVPRKTYEQSS